MTTASPSFEAPLVSVLEAVSLRRHFAEGSVVLAQGAEITHVPIVVSGTLKVSLTEVGGRELLLYYVQPGEGCAMTFTCCLKTQHSDIVAEAETDVELLLVPVGYMSEWIQQFPSWKAFVMDTIHLRFKELLKALELIAFQRLDERLIHFLKHKQSVASSTVINLSHEQIAHEMGTSREVISRLLKRLEHDGKLLLYRHQIKLLSTM